MPQTPQEIARDRVQALADDPRYRPFVVGYLLSCLDERHWTALVDAALEYVEGLEAHRQELSRRAQSLSSERG